MKKFFCIFCTLLLLTGLMSSTQTYAASKNNYPIVLVHGFIGWGNDEMLGFKYFGGLTGIERYLNNKGIKTLTASVGAISSDWDRACELYAYVKGGKVDYGAAHAKKYGHERYGKTYPGIYTGWSATNKIHLLGHSMGGLTIRDLLALLKNGNKEEQDYAKANPSAGISDLFKGGKDWVSSITTIATPNNGSTVFNNLSDTRAFIKNSLINFAGLAGVAPANMLYNFDLEQWGLSQNKGETFLQYTDRVLNSKIWNSKDIGQYDITTQGANIIKSRTPMQSNVYYFAYSGDATNQNILTKICTPMLNMNPVLVPYSTTMGRYSDVAWRPNDGAVNTISAKNPTGQNFVNYSNGQAVKPGVWNVYPVKKGWDHVDFIQPTPPVSVTDLYNFYTDIANQLVNLPN